MSIEVFSNNATVERIMPVLERDGVVIIRRIVPDSLMNHLVEDVGTGLDRRKPAGGKFFWLSHQAHGGAHWTLQRVRRNDRGANADGCC